MELGSGSNTMEVQNNKRKSRSNDKLEFLGWGSKPLIEFLDSIGKKSKQYSQEDVDAIVKKYVTSNDLMDPRKKRKILCDEKLEKLFKKKSVSRSVYHLLEAHLRENHDDDDVNEAQDIPKTSFAAISAENIKLIFLRLGFVEGLLKENPETFEEDDYITFGRPNASAMHPNPARHNYNQQFSALMVNSVRAQAQQLQQQQQQQRRAQALQQLQQFQQRQSSMGGGNGASSSRTHQGLPGTVVAEDPMAFVWHGADDRGYIEGGPVCLNQLRIWFQQGHFGPDFRVWKIGQHQSQSVLLLRLLNTLNLL